MPLGGDGVSGLRKVDAPFTTVDNAVAEDSSLSFRARGVLVYLLAKPDGWGVRAEAIARDGTEGREAILAVLRELGARGHYRIVRYREGGPGGVWKTETEVSHRPIPEWATQWAANGGKPIVRRENPQVTPENGFPGLGDEAPQTDPQVTPETGFPDAGRPPSGEAASGSPDALVKTQNNETDEHHEPAGAASDEADVIEIDTKAKRHPDVQAVYEVAREVVTAYMDWWKVDRGMPADSPIPDGWRQMATLVGARAKPENCQYVTDALLKRYTRKQVALALANWAQGKHNGGRKPQGIVPSKNAWIEALAAVAAGRAPTGGRPDAYSNEAVWGTGGDGGWGASALGDTK